MRNQWRLLLRYNLLSSPRVSRSLPLPQVTVNSSSLSSVYTPKNPNFFPNFGRFYSNGTPAIQKSNDPSVIIAIFTKPINGLEISKELESSDVVISVDVVCEALKNPTLDHGVAVKMFDWIKERESDKLSSNLYNLMLGIYGGNGYVKEFWEMLSEMKKKGFGIKRGAFDRVLEKFEKDGLSDEVEKLKGLFVKDVSSVENASSKISKIVRREVWDEKVEKELRELGVSYTSELVRMVLEKLGTEPIRGLIFFRWVEESGLFKHDEVTYNAMAVVLGREDCIDRFWNVVGDMRNAGYEMELKTYVKVLDRFVKRMMMNDVVSLYEFAMNGASKPSKQDCTFLLKKLAVAKTLDMELFSRVVKAYTEKGFSLDDSMLDAVLKSLTSIGRMKECNTVLDAMVEAGFTPSAAMQGRVAYDLSSSKLEGEANQFMEKLDATGVAADYKTWSSLIEGHCVAGDFDKARDCLTEMVEKHGVSHAGYALDLLVSAYCNRYRAAEACKLLSDLVDKKDVKPWHVTYKTLISKLLTQKGFQDALPVLGLMKKHGLPPFLDPFVRYLSTKGTTDEAMLFFKAMTVKRYPSTNVFLRVFEAYSEAKRYKQAQNLLAKCPHFIRNNADVLNLFASMKPEEPAQPVAVAA